ncbi:MAG: hypothetical protein INH37_23155, partial [Myxococcaceae bacterium]|nr:hypothetical protein [Myxococcaceae bacterium]
GPETAARFMAEAFADEHQAERKMLTELQAQARALHEDTEGDEAPRAPAKSTLEVSASKAAQTRDEVPVPPEPSPEALSFQPTRKSAVTAKSQPLQPVMAPEGRATLEAEPAAVVVDDALAGLARAAPDARVTKAPPKPKPAGRNSSIRPLPPVKSGSNHNLPPVQRATPPEADVSRARAPAKAAAPSETLDQAPPAEAVTSPGTARKAGGVWVWVALPLFAIAAVATYIAWDLQTQALPPRQDAVAPTEAEPAEAPRSREVKVPGAEVAPAPEAELDELAAPGKLTKKKLAPAPRAISKPAMLSKVRVLVDDVPAARGKLKLTMRLSELEKQAGQPGNEAEFTSQVRALEADAKAALEGP